MKQSQEDHLFDIIDKFSVMVDKKYRKGQREHGGDLWLKAGLINFAIEEALDQVVYLLTLKSQLDSGDYYSLTKRDKDQIKAKVKRAVKKDAK